MISSKARLYMTFFAGYITAAFFFCVVLCLAVLLGGCASSPRVEPVSFALPVPTRPDWVRYQEGDFTCMDEAARTRLAQRHAQTTWYMRELENTLHLYSKQVDPQKGNSTRGNP